MLQALKNRMNRRSCVSLAAAVIGSAALLLNGCGGSGGGGGGAASPTAIAAPTVALQPQSQTIADGQPATFTVVAVGSAPLAYQWLRGGQAIAGATQASYTITAAQLSDSGASFSVAVSNAAGSVTSAAAVLTVRAVAPAIANNAPQSVSVLQGATATFNVTVSGSSPLTFQWRRNGVAIGGATTSSYTTPATTTSDNGAVFDVVATNAAGTVTSAPFTLTVTSSTQPATIASQPQAVTVRAGDAATFNVVAGGTAPFTYQWLRSGQVIAGANGSSYTLANAQTSDNNVAFSVIVSNAAGTVTSGGAILMVLPQPGIAVVAGNIGGGGTIDGSGTVARFAQPNNVAIDNGGNLYVADGFNVRKVTAAGAVSLFAGSPTVAGSADGPAAAATFRNLKGITVAPSGIVYLADADAHTIRRIDVAGTVTTFAGTAGTSGSSDGNGTAALFDQVKGLATDTAGNVYVADTNQIRRITPEGTVTTVAGSAANPGSADGTGAAARFAGPSGVTVDGAGNLYVADTGNHAVRIVSPLGVVTTLAGSAGNRGSMDGVGVAASFDQPTGIAIDGSGNLYVSDVGGAVVRKIAAGAVVTTIAGTATATGYVDGTAGAARFAYPFGIASDASGVLFVVDRVNFDVRRIAGNGVVTRFAGLPAIAGSVDGTGSAAQFNLPFSIAIDAAANLYVGDYNNASIRKVTPGGVVSTLAGGGSSATFTSVQGIAVDPAGNVYVADRNAGTIRKVAPNGAVTTLAGTAGVAGSADGTGAAASFKMPTAIVYDSDGNLYVVDGNPTIRRVTTSGVVTTIAGAAGRTGSADGPGSVASFSLPQGIAADAAGNLYVTDTPNSTIRKVTTSGVVSTIAGTAGQTGATDGNGVTARFTLPFGIAVDPAGNLFVMDTTAPTLSLGGGGGLTQTVNARFTLRRIDTAGNVTTVAGVADGVRGVKVGPLPGHFDGLYEIAIDGQGNVYGPSANGILRITFP